MPGSCNLSNNQRLKATERRTLKRLKKLNEYRGFKSYKPICSVQSLVHIPHLRDYFLTDQHTCKYQSENGHGDPNLCLMCELYNIFQEFYNGQSDPFVPQRMLHLVWTHAEHLAGYGNQSFKERIPLVVSEQHDAHEFLISTLNVLHKHSESKQPFCKRYPSFQAIQLK